MFMDAASPFSVTVRWTLTEPLPSDLGGTFLLQAFAEAIAPGLIHDFFLGEVEITVHEVRGMTSLQTIIPVPQGVPVRGCFKLTAVLIQLRDGRPTGEQAFLDGPVIEFVN